MGRESRLARPCYWLAIPRWRNRPILRASITAWAARLCQETSLGLLADIDPCSIDGSGEAIRRNADGGVGRAACSHDFAKAFQLDIEEHRQRSGKAEGRDGA